MVTFNFGASSTLVGQIRAGAPAEDGFTAHAAMSVGSTLVEEGLINGRHTTDRGTLCLLGWLHDRPSVDAGRAARPSPYPSSRGEPSCRLPGHRPEPSTTQTLTLRQSCPSERYAFGMQWWSSTERRQTQVIGAALLAILLVLAGGCISSVVDRVL